MSTLPIGQEVGTVQPSASVSPCPHVEPIDPSQIQYRVLVPIPPPQVTEHLLHGVQSVNIVNTQDEHPP